MYSGEAVETGAVRDVFGAVRHPYTQGLFRSMPMPGTNKNDNPLVPIPGQLPLPHERPKGCNFGPRCEYFVEGLCDQADVPMREVAGARGHQSRCLRVEAIDWAAVGALAATARAGRDRRAGPRRRAAEEALSRRRRARLFGRRRGPRGQGGRGHLVRRPRGGGAGDRRRIGLRQVDPRQGAARARDGERRPGRLRSARRSRTSRSRSRAVKTIASIQMIFQNPFDTLNPSYSVGSQIVRTLERFRIGANNAERREMMLRLLDLVKLPRAFAARSPAAIVGRPEAAHRRRARLRRAAAGDHRRRADVGARRFGAGGDQRAPDEPAARVEDHHGVHQPRSVGGALSRRPRRRHVSRPYRRDGRDRADLHAALPPLYRGAPVGDPDRRRQGEEAPCRARGRDPLGAVAADRLSVPDPLRAQARRSGRICASARCRRPRTVAEGHTIKCHLPVEALERMEPVFA